MKSEMTGYLDALPERVDRIERKLDSLSVSVDMRFEQVDKRFEQVDKRFDQVSEHFVEQRQYAEFLFEHLDRKMTAGFERLERAIGVGSERMDRMEKAIGVGSAYIERMERKLDQFIDSQSRAASPRRSTRKPKAR